MYKIYKLVYQGKVVYVGITKTSLERRRNAGYKWNEELHSIKNDCEMVLLEETDDVSRERYWIDFYGIENLYNEMKGGGMTSMEKKEYMKKYRKENREKHNEQLKEWKKNNREKWLELRREWREKNRDEIRQRDRERYHKNKKKE